jgi:hypothetical protein
MSFVACNRIDLCFYLAGSILWVYFIKDPKFNRKYRSLNAFGAWGGLI